MRVNITWRRSSHDGQGHAFPLAQVAEPGRSYPGSDLLTQRTPEACWSPAGHRPGQNHVDGHWAALLDASSCLACLVLVSDQLAEAGRHGTPPP